MIGARNEKIDRLYRRVSWLRKGKGNIETLYLAKFVGHAQHMIRGAPSDIAVKCNLEGIWNAAFDLKLVKGFDALPRRLNLM
jgi:hypothetical protein